MLVQSTSEAVAAQRSLWVDALLGVPKLDNHQWQHASIVLRWLIAVRASVLPLTVFAVLFAWCLAWPTSLEQWSVALLCLVALTLAHATNNLINDYVDYARGLDRDDYFRAKYGVHLLASRICDKQSLRRYIWVTGSSALVLGGWVCWLAGGWAYAFALAGGALLLFYTYPLKHWALGELAVLCAWGPLMVGGTYFCITAELPSGVLWTGFVYGLGPAVVIFAKHVDKSQQDRAKGVITLPVLLQPFLGDGPLRAIIPGLAVLQLVAALLAAALANHWGLAGCLLAIPALRNLVGVTRQPPPDECPENYPAQAWPLWFTTHAFVYARNAGAGLLIGVCLQQLLA